MFWHDIEKLTFSPKLKSADVINPEPILARTFNCLHYCSFHVSMKSGCIRPPIFFLSLYCANINPLYFHMVFRSFSITAKIKHSEIWIVISLKLEIKLWEQYWVSSPWARKAHYLFRPFKNSLSKDLIHFFLKSPITFGFNNIVNDI